jgi:hydroxymethylpyrimidine kinase/phosphomethylpyrimidine kinase
MERVCLTIAGLDPSGGAGVIADVKTFSAFGCFATAAVTSLTFQNTTGVFGTLDQTAAAVRGQVEPILNDFDLAALKTGMLPSRAVIEETANLINEFSLKNLVVDPVVRSTSGFDLIDDTALRALIEKIFPIANLITPNLPEAERITGMKLTDRPSVEVAASAMRSMGAQNVLIKGGHMVESQIEGETRIARDFLFLEDEIFVLDAEYIETTSTHGTGCTLSAAIAANLALGKSLVEAVQIAKDFVHEGIRTAPQLGHGHSPVNIRFI